MSGYLHFDMTGVPEIDAISDRLESAGNGYHHTENWGDKDEWRGGKSYIDLIQEALNAAADALIKSRANSVTNIPIAATGRPFEKTGVLIQEQPHTDRQEQ